MIEHVVSRPSSPLVGLSDGVALVLTSYLRLNMVDTGDLDPLVQARSVMVRTLCIVVKDSEGLFPRHYPDLSTSGCRVA